MERTNHVHTSSWTQVGTMFSAHCRSDSKLRGNHLKEMLLDDTWPLLINPTIELDLHCPAPHAIGWLDLVTIDERMQSSRSLTICHLCSSREHRWTQVFAEHCPARPKNIYTTKSSFLFISLLYLLQSGQVDVKCQFGFQLVRQDAQCRAGVTSTLNPPSVKYTDTWW